MIAGIADTHTALWYLYADPRLSVSAKNFIDEAAGRADKIGLSTISLAEIVYLMEKGRIPSNALDDLLSAPRDAGHVFEEAPLTLGIVDAMRRISRGSVPDLPDRIVAATAARWGVPVLSRDGQIRTSSIPTVW